MRRMLAALLLLAAACSTPPIILSPRFEPGDARIYELTADATTTIDLGRGPQQQHTLLRARSTIEVLSTDGAQTVVRLTLSPRSFTRDGLEADPPPEQRAELILGPDGEVRSIRSIGDVPAGIIGTDVQDLAPLLGSPLPSERMRLGDTWETPVPGPADQPPQIAGAQRGRVAGARVVRGFDCAMVVLATHRPLARQRTVGDQTLRLAGTETSASEIAFSFRDGFAVEIHTTSEGVFSVGDASVTGGTVTINGTTDLVLLEQR